LKLITEDYVPEITATMDLYHRWLEADARAVGAIVDVEGKRRIHQVLGEIEHVQRGIRMKRHDYAEWHLLKPKPPSSRRRPGSIRTDSGRFSGFRPAPE
jgi:hypothetical protein